MFDYRSIGAAGNKGLLLALVEGAMPIREGRFVSGSHCHAEGQG